MEFKSLITDLLDWKSIIIPSLKKIKEQLFDKKTVAPLQMWDYLGYSGTVAASLIVLQVCTGILLLFYYSPNESKAFETIVTIRNNWPFGILFLNMHAIGAKLIIWIVIIHMSRIILTSAYRGPRRAQWYTGFALLSLMLCFGFTGYLLPWSQQSYWASIIGTEALKSISIIGDVFVWLLIGEEETQFTILLRTFCLHCIVFPILFIVLIWHHFKQVLRTRIIAPPDMHAFFNLSLNMCNGCGLCEKVCNFNAVELDYKNEKNPIFNILKCNACRSCMEKCPKSCIGLTSDSGAIILEPIFPNSIMRRLSTILTVLIVYFSSVYFFYSYILSTKIPADPMITPENIKPDWYFLAPYQVLKLMPNEWSGLLILMLFYISLIILPIIDSQGPRNPKQRKIFIPFIKTCLSVFLIFTIWGWLS